MKVAYMHLHAPTPEHRFFRCYRNIASSKGCLEVYLVFVVNSSIESNNPDGSRGDSFVKNLKHPTVFLPLEGRGMPLLSHSGIFAI